MINKYLQKISTLFLVTLLAMTTQSCTKSKTEAIDDDFPLKLSKIGIFIDPISDLNPSDEYNLFELSSPLFSDYAEKLRLIKLPPGEQLTKIKSGLPSFPNGTSLVKTFYYWNDKRDTSKGKQILETRFLVKRNNDWKVAAYQWNNEQTEAFLLTSGNDEPVNWINENGEGKVTTYHIPSTKECVTCHQTSGKLLPLGPKLNNLNHQVIRNSVSINQLEHFQQLSLLSDFEVSEVDSLPNYKDKSNDIVARGRAYMEVNCSHCHSPGGFTPEWIEFDFRNDTPINETGMIENKSMIIENIENGTMPFTGTSIVDKEGIEMLVEFLNTL